MHITFIVLTAKYLIECLLLKSFFGKHTKLLRELLF